MLDRKGRFVYASPSYRRVLGYDPARLVGVSLFDLLHPDDRASAYAAWEQIDAHGTAQAAFRTGHAQGSWRWIEASATAIVRGGITYIVGVARDVTARRQLEAQFLQAQKMESVGRLAGGVAHDFNNLLTAISGYVDLALDALPVGDPVRYYLGEVKKATQRAMQLTRQLLAFARKQVIAPQILNLNELIIDLDRLLHRLIGEDIELVTLRGLSEPIQARSNRC
jgi:PAS domain S-box-containing protein